MLWNMFNHLLKDQRKLFHGRSSSIKKCFFFFFYYHRHHHHIAIVGTGPSGLYTAKYLIEYYQKLILKDNKCNHQQQQQQQQIQNTVNISHNNDITLHTYSYNHHQQQQQHHRHHHTQQIYIDFFEKLPTPYGLVRSGVAPDHPEVKSVEETFKKVLNSNNIRFFGNVIIHNNVKDNNNDDILYDIEGVENDNDNGASRRDVLRYVDDDDDDNINNQSKQYHISLDDLRLSYSAIILAYGATSDIPLPLAYNDAVDGDDIRNILSAREFVHWYNGHPDYANLFENKGLR